jgi:hypothetical protein
MPLPNPLPDAPGAPGTHFLPLATAVTFDYCSGMQAVGMKMAIRIDAGKGAVLFRQVPTANVSECSFHVPSTGRLDTLEIRCFPKNS